MNGLGNPIAGHVLCIGPRNGEEAFPRIEQSFLSDGVSPRRSSTSNYMIVESGRDRP